MKNLNSNADCFQPVLLTKLELRKITGGAPPPGDPDGTGNQGGIWAWFKDIFK